MVTIDPELQSWIIPLKQEVRDALKKSILEDGCRDAIVIWNDVIVDGHNRYAICTEHNIPFNTVEKTFVNKNEAKLWMVDNQIARRNLEAIERIALVMKGEGLIAEMARENEIIRKGNQAGASLVILPNLINDTTTTPDEPPIEHPPVHTQTTPRVIVPIHTREVAAKQASGNATQQGIVALGNPTQLVV